MCSLDPCEAELSDINTEGSLKQSDPLKQNHVLVGLVGIPHGQGQWLLDQTRAQCSSPGAVCGGDGELSWGLGLEENTQLQNSEEAECGEIAQEYCGDFKQPLSSVLLGMHLKSKYVPGIEPFVARDLPSGNTADP